MTNWGADEGWYYDYYPLDVAEDVFPLHAAALRIWRARGKGRIPAWSDFDLPMDFEGLWGWLTVFDAVAGDSLSFDVRLWGTRITEVAGYDATGTRFSPAPRPARADASTITDSDLKFIRYVLDNGVIGYNYGPLHVELGDEIRYEEIVLPLSSDGVTNDQVLFCGVRIDMDDG